MLRPFRAAFRKWSHPAVGPRSPEADSIGSNRCEKQAAQAAEMGLWDEAGMAFRDSLRLAPQRMEVARSMVQCAAALARSGATPATPKPGYSTAMAVGRISVIVCSINSEKLARLKASLDGHLALQDWELIHIADARSMCDGYARGLARSTGSLVVFCHDDIGILSDKFCDRLRQYLGTYDLIGVAGSELLSGPTCFWAGAPHAHSWVCTPRERGFTVGVLSGYGPTIKSAQVLDGVFIAGHRRVFEHLGFDSERFDGFHLYDLDLSWRAHLAGYKAAIALDLNIWHESGGNFDGRWAKYAERFMDKFPQIRNKQDCVPLAPLGVSIESAELVPKVYAWITKWVSSP